MHGQQPLTGEQVRDGLENLDITEERLAELGMSGFTPPIKVSCADHEGDHAIRVQQWDGEQWEFDHRLDHADEGRGAADDRGLGRRPTPRRRASRRATARAERRSALPAVSATALAATAERPGPAAARDLLVVNNIEVVYDHVILVLKGVSLAVPEGGVVALLGANGAGKTTTLKAISNLLRVERGEVTKGTIELAGQNVAALSPTELVRRGVVQVMEGRHCFEHLTVEENLLTGAYTRNDGKAAIAARPRPGLRLLPAAARSAAARRPATPRAASSR